MSSINGGSAKGSPVVLITGALTGIGRAAAVIFAHEGARVVVSGRRDRPGKELVAELQALGAERSRGCVDTNVSDRSPGSREFLFPVIRRRVEGVQGGSRRGFPTEMLGDCRCHKFFCAAHCSFE